MDQAPVTTNNNPSSGIDKENKAFADSAESVRAAQESAKERLRNVLGSCPQISVTEDNDEDESEGRMHERPQSPVTSFFSVLEDKVRSFVQDNDVKDLDILQSRMMSAIDEMAQERMKNTKEESDEE